VPPGVDSDEASIGVNAFMLARTGRDEYGTVLPLAFRALGEFKRPAYIYAAVPSVRLLGLTPLSVRLPAALAGTVAVAALYALAMVLLKDRRAALLAAGMLAVSPWHLQFTRTAREASLLVLALILFALALLWTLQKVAGDGAPAPIEDGWRSRQSWGLVGAAGAALLALYSYPGALVLLPLVGAVLVRAYWGQVVRLARRPLLIALAVLVVGMVPLGVQLVDGRARPRWESVLSDPQVTQLSEARVARDRVDGAPWVLQVPLAVAARQVVDNYLAHFSPRFLFTRGDPDWRNHSSDSAQLHLWDLPLLLAGTVAVVRGRHLPAMQAIGGWLVVAPLPAAFGARAPDAVQSIGMLPALYLLAAAGFPALWEWLHSLGCRLGHGRLRSLGSRWRREPVSGLERTLGPAWLGLLGVSVGLYLYGYYWLYPVEHARDWHAGYLEGYQEAKALVESDASGGRYSRIVIPEEMGLSYVYALFGTQYDPARYLEQGGSRIDPTYGAYPAPGPMTFAPFEVRTVDWRTERHDPSVLYVTEGGSPPPVGTEIVHVTKAPDGREVLQLVRLSE
jgi:4-amino-4-deoxy-L-arabinose transferase-like glycosyltransferase